MKARIEVWDGLHYKLLGIYNIDKMQPKNDEGEVLEILLDEVEP